MIIKRKEYVELKSKVSECYEMEKIIAELKRKVTEYESGEHQCGDLCKGCQHLVETKTLNFSLYSVSGHREMTTRKCALDRKCKDYKPKKESEE